jgi:hypothetical protein
MKSSDIEMKERKALAGSTTTMSYHTRALAELQLEQGQSGRFTDKASVNGSKPAVAYPRQPEGSPWAGDLVPPEEPLGWSVEAQEPVGEPHEIAASLAAAAPEVPSVRAAAPSSGFMSPREGGADPLTRGRRL